MQNVQEEDIAGNGLELSSATSTWVLGRHQWLIDNMRCVLTGENAPSTAELEDLNDLVPEHLKLPKHLTDHFALIKEQLEEAWSKAAKAVHPMSGLSIFEQLNNYQEAAHNFMQVSKEANQALLHELALRDSLTGARSRLTLNTNLFQTLKKALRHDETCSVALLDHDNFKLINDTWGHVTGDLVLATVANLIQANLREKDMLFRYGGDEWLIIMPNTEEKVASKIFGRVQEVCHQHEFKSTNNQSFFITLSVGIAASDKSLTPKEWIALADSKLHKIKQKTASRGQVESRSKENAN